MTVVDGQVHTWLPNGNASHPWAPDHPTGFFETQVEAHPVERVIADMDEAGVDAAIVVVPRLYGWDNSYALEAAKKFPDRMAVVGRFDWTLPDHVERLRDFMTTPGMVGTRLPRECPGAWSPNGAFAEMLAAAEALDVPVCAMPGPANLGALRDVAARHEGLRLVIDHLGMEAPPQTVPRPGPDAFLHLPELLSLSAYPNVYVKLTAAPALSNEPFPFRDIWRPIHEILEHFGDDRVLWGSDYNRVKTLYPYSEGVRYLYEMGLDDTVLSSLLEGTVTRVFNLPRKAASTGRPTLGI